MPLETSVPKAPPRVLPVARLAKAAVAVVLVGLLIDQAQRSEAMAQLAEGDKNWPLLAMGLATTIGAVALSFVRWRLVALAAGLALPIGEALRYGALGFALTFVGPGALGGDLLKAVALSRNRKGQRVAASTTVFVDRALGLMAMLLTASLAILAFRVAGAAPTGAAWLVAQSTLVVTAGALVGGGLLLVPGFARGAIARRLAAAPVVGGVAASILRLWGDYQRRPAVLAAALGVSLLVDVLLVLSFYCVAIGLPLQAPTMLEHFFIVPISLIAAALPITPGGVGVREGVADVLYRGFGVPAGQGTLIAGGHTLMMLAAGGVAVVYYLIERGRGDRLVSSLEEAAVTEPDPSA